MPIANYEPWLGLVKVQNLAQAIARARLVWNELDSNKLELIRFFDPSNPQFYCITSVTMIDPTYLNMFSLIMKVRFNRMIYTMYTLNTLDNYEINGE